MKFYILKIGHPMVVLSRLHKYTLFMFTFLLKKNTSCIMAKKIYFIAVTYFTLTVEFNNTIIIYVNR